MKKDTHKTKVIFLYHEPNQDLFAFFPELHESGDNKLSYTHIGQHSECSWDYVDECRLASETERTDLFKELESIGYNLELTVLNAV